MNKNSLLVKAVSELPFEKTQKSMLMETILDLSPEKSSIIINNIEETNKNLDDLFNDEEYESHIKSLSTNFEDNAFNISIKFPQYISYNIECKIMYNLFVNYLTYLKPYIECFNVIIYRKYTRSNYRHSSFMHKGRHRISSGAFAYDKGGKFSVIMNFTIRNSNTEISLNNSDNDIKLVLANLLDDTIRQLNISASISRSFISAIRKEISVLKDNGRGPDIFDGNSDSIHLKKVANGRY